MHSAAIAHSTFMHMHNAQCEMMLLSLMIYHALLMRCDVMCDRASNGVCQAIARPPPPKGTVPTPYLTSYGVGPGMHAKVEKVICM